MTTPGAIEELERGRAEIGALLADLKAALGDELDALRHQDAARLEATVQHKAALIAAIEGATGKYCRPGQPLPEGWDDIRTLAATCAEANRVNGGAIQLSHGLVQRLLEITHGTRLSTSTYTASGKLGQRESSRGVGYA